MNIQQNQRIGLSIILLLFVLNISGIRGSVARPLQGPSGERNSLDNGKNELSLPLATTRTIKFTTEEGTWMSLDISPDGKTIVFDLVGDLYTLPITGGVATRITSGPAFDGQPRYSPDGKTIVFTSDRSGSDNLWLADQDGQNPRALTLVEEASFVSPEWTPDGSAIIVSKRIGAETSAYDLYLYHPSGGAGIKLTAGGYLDRYLGAAFGKEGRYVFASTGRHGVGSAPGRYQIVVYDRQTGRASRRTEAAGGALRPVLSPDGRYLVYATRKVAETALMLRDLRTDYETSLARSVQYDTQQLGRSTRDLMPGAAFTPDSTALITAHHGKIWRIEVPSGRATMIPFKAEIEQSLGPLARFNHSLGDEASITVREIRGARPSPDGKRLVFTALDRLWLADLPGGRSPRRLTKMKVGEHTPVWSPDGKYVAYATWDDTEGGAIYRIKVDEASAPERLTSVSSFYYNVNYSPDGEELFAIREPKRVRAESVLETFTFESNEPKLVSLPASGGSEAEIHQMATKGYEFYPYWFNGTPHFARDSDRVYIRDVNDGLISMRLDGSDRRIVLKVTQWDDFRAAELVADEIILSPTGTAAIALINQQLYLITLPPEIPSGLTISVSNLAGSPVPIHRITRVGADFIGWRPDGKGFYYSLGRTFFTYDLDKVESIPGPTPEKDNNGFTRADESATRRTDIGITAPRDKAEGIVALRGARVITMNGDQIFDSGDIVIRNRQIESVGPSGRVRIPSEARVIDISGKTVLPGLLDIHDHIHLRQHIHRTQAWQYRATLAYGVTTSRDPQTATTDIFTYADLVETGTLLGPRRLSTGPGILPKYGITSLSDTRNVLRRYSEHYQTQTVKQYYSPGTRRQRQWFIIAARDLGLTSTVEGSGDFRLNLTHILDGYPAIEHEFGLFPLYRDVVELLARSGTINTVTFVGNPGVSAEDYYYTHEDVWGDEKLRYFTPEERLELRALRRSEWYHESQFEHQKIAAQYAKIIAAGGKVGSGAHGNLNGLGTHWNLWALASGGTPLIEVLRSATIYNAEAIGLEREIGSLEPGKVADLIVLDKNPLEDIRHTTSVRYVMKNGRLYEARTLKEIWPRERMPDPGWWERIRFPSPLSH